MINDGRECIVNGLVDWDLVRLKEKEMAKEKKMKTLNLKVKAHKVEVVWAEEVVYSIVQCAKNNGWQCSIDAVNDALYSDPSWTWGDAAMTLINGEVFVSEVFEALNNTCTAEGNDFSVDFKFKYVALEG